jgi:putative transposase
MSSFVTYKVDGRYPDCIRQQVVAKMLNYLDKKVYMGLGYNLSCEEYDMLCTDEYTGQRICPNKTGRRWLTDAKLGKFKSLPRYKGGPAKRLTNEVKAILYGLVTEIPTATAFYYEQCLYELTGEQFHPNYLQRVINSLGLSLKKICYEKKYKFYPENMQYYEHYVNLYKSIDRRRLVFVDQTGFNRFNFHPKRGRAPRGARCFVNKQPNKGKRISATGFLCYDVNRAPFFYCLSEGHGDFDAWLDFVHEAHARNFILPGDILVVDNWSGFVGTNTGGVLAEELKKIGISVWPLPKYSPELNPIELLWNYLKNKCRTMLSPETDEETYFMLNVLFSSVNDVIVYCQHVDKYISSL